MLFWCGTDHHPGFGELLWNLVTERHGLALAISLTFGLYVGVPLEVCRSSRAAWGRV